MKILLLADGLECSALNEAALWLCEVLARWLERGYEVQVVCAQPLEPWQEPEDPPGVPVWRPGPGDFEDALGEALAHEPDVVHVASAGPFGPRVAEILHELPVLLDVHDFWPICPNGDLLRRPHLDPCGEHYPFHGCGRCAGLSRLRAMEEKSELAASARMVVAHSGFNRVRLNAGLMRAIELLDYGVDTRRFGPDPSPPATPEIGALFATRDRPRALLLGPPTPGHGAPLLTDLIVAAQARVGHFELVVAGRDPGNPDWDQVFRAETRELGLAGHVVILPSVPRGDLPALYASCQVAIAPGDGYEPGGLFALQAMATGLPVLANPAGALEELIHQGGEGMLVSSQDIVAFASALSVLLIDPAARNAFGESGRLAVVERHDFERTVHALEDLYDRLRTSPQMRAASGY